MPTPGKVIPERVCKRALGAYVLDPDTGCHISTYSVASHGYAQIGWTKADGKNDGTTAHRAAWTAVHGQIPEGITIDHRCPNGRNRRCVNVEHLRELVNFENARRTSGRDWTLGFCILGHPNSEITFHGKKRVCRVCSRIWQRRYRARVALGMVGQAA